MIKLDSGVVMNKHDKITAETNRLIRSGERAAKKAEAAEHLRSSSSDDLDSGINPVSGTRVRVIIEREDPPKPDDK